MNESIVDILLVEDRAEDAELTMMGLKKFNLINRVDWVKDGEEALEYLYGTGRYEHRNKSAKPKLILLDLKMPKVDGIQVLKAIRADENLKAIPVVILTTSREEEGLLEAYNYGINAYILKPVEFTKFLEAMKTLGMFWILLNQRTY